MIRHRVSHGGLYCQIGSATIPTQVDLSGYIGFVISMNRSKQMSLLNDVINGVKWVQILFDVHYITCIIGYNNYA